jgi:hypothetical protein
MKKYKTLNDMSMSKEWAVKEGYEAFEANILDLIARGVIGYKENGKNVVPNKADIREAFVKLTGLPILKKAE